MSWSRKFAKPIILKDGRTIGHSARRASSFWRCRANPTAAAVQYAGELLLNAADQGVDLTDAWAQLRRVPIVEGCSAPSECRRGVTVCRENRRRPTENTSVYEGVARVSDDDTVGGSREARHPPKRALAASNLAISHIRRIDEAIARVLRCRVIDLLKGPPKRMCSGKRARASWFRSCRFRGGGATKHARQPIVMRVERVPHADL